MNKLAVLGDKMFKAGKYKTAIDYYTLYQDTIDQHSQEYAETSCNIGKAYSQMDKHEKAIEELNKGLELLHKWFEEGHSALRTVELQIDYSKSQMERDIDRNISPETLHKVFKRFYEIDKTYMLEEWCIGIITALKSAYRDFDDKAERDQHKLFKRLDLLLSTDEQHVRIPNIQSFQAVFGKIAYETARKTQGKRYQQPKIPILRRNYHAS